MVRLYLARDAGLRVNWTSRRQESGALLFQAEAPDSLRDLAAKHSGYDYAINCIAVLKNAAEDSGPQGATAAHQTNAVFPHDLARVAAEIDCKLVHVSTDGVFAPNSGVCLESDVPAPTDLYGRTKLLGEPSAPNALTIRCSIIGPNPVKKTGLFEWVIGQPRGARIKGYHNQLWRGVTTMQFAELCARVFRDELFVRLREESAVHHFCPNAAVTKFQLVQTLSRRFRPDLLVERATGAPVNRVLESRGMLRELCGFERPMNIAIEELSTYIDGPNAAGA